MGRGWWDRVRIDWWSRLRTDDTLNATDTIGSAAATHYSTLQHTRLIAWQTSSPVPCHCRATSHDKQPIMATQRLNDARDDTQPIVGKSWVKDLCPLPLRACSVCRMGRRKGHSLLIQCLSDVAACMSAHTHARYAYSDPQLLEGTTLMTHSTLDRCEKTRDTLQRAV